MGRKEEIKLFLFAESMIIQLANSKEKIPETISNYNYIAGYKVNTQKSIAFLSISNGLMEFDIGRKIPFTIAPKSKNLAINLTKYVQDLGMENQKNLMKKTHERTKSMERYF